MTLKAKIRLQKSTPKPVCRPVTDNTPDLPKVPAKVAHQMARRRIAAAKLQVADHEYSKRIPEIKRLIKESVAKLPKDIHLNGAKTLARQLTASLDEWQRLYKSTPK
jgi:hypothetical protein